MPIINPKIFTYLRQFRKKAILMGGALLMFEGFKMIPPFIFALIVDSLLEVSSKTFSVVAQLIALFFIASVVSHVFEYFVERYSTKVYCRVHTHLLQLAGDKLLKLSLAYHENRNTGTQVARIHRGVDRLMIMMFELHDQLIPTSFQIILSFLIISYIHLLSGLVFLAIIPFFVVYSLWMAKNLQPLRLEYHKIEEDAAGKLGENIINIRTVQDFAQESKARQAHISMLEQFYDGFTKRCRYETNRKFWRDMMLAAGRVAAMLFFVYMVIQGEITAGELVFFVTLSEKSYLALYRIGRIFDRSADSAEGVNLMLEVLEEKEKVKDLPNAVDINSVEGDLKFKNVSFAYPSSKQEVLKNINFEISSKKMLALVGRSGSGKSTIVKLLFRHFDVENGQILLDGKDIRNYTKKSLRSHLAIVAQDVEIFNNDILSNIKYGKPDATDEEAFTAAKVANCHEFIIGFENGYKTIVGERGVKLSGGQKQRIGIARAILKKPTVLIFDEATSSLDTESEKLIQDSMLKVSEQCTMIVIAHRLSTIEHADKIVVLNDNQVAEIGTHKELMAHKGIFARMQELQGIGEIRR